MADDHASQVLDALGVLGPPLLVPASPFDGWRITGWGRTSDAGVPTAHISVGIHGPDGQLTVETTSTARGHDVWRMSSKVLLALVDEDLTFPWTATLDRRDVDISVDGEPLPTILIDAGRCWAAAVEIDGRWCELSATGVPVEAVALTRVNDLEAIAESRFLGGTA
jgi:hypothetical protein